MVCGFCAVSQSCSSSRVSTDASTDTGISTIPLGMQSDYQLTLEKQTLLAHALPTLVVRRQWSRSPPKATLLGNFFELLAYEPSTNSSKNSHEFFKANLRLPQNAP